MTLSTAIELIEPGFRHRRDGATTWADLGCGSGLFTHALSSFLAPASRIYAMDKNTSLPSQTTGNSVNIISITADFLQDPLPEKGLDGVLMANALHYVKDKPAFLLQAASYLKPGGTFLIAEYDTDVPVIPWVPYPVTFPGLQSLFQSAGFSRGQKLAQRPSAYRRQLLYTALFTKITS